MRYFISNLHIEDNNILIYEHRPFATLHEMRKYIVTNWNETVGNRSI